jgi:PKHD-type hydroxylase
MLITIPQLLDPATLQTVRSLLDPPDRPGWMARDRRLPGRAGEIQPADRRASEVALQCQHLIVSALERHPRFISAALPNLIYPPMFNRYGEGMTFGAHVDGSVRIHPHSGRKLRTDVSATLFLADPADYDGGELQIDDSYGMHSVKLAAGDMVLYPATSLHTVTPVTRGVRVGCFFWVQSLVRDDGQRQMLFDMDNAIQRLNQTDADALARRTLVGCYHNLLRQWSET